MNTTLTYAKSFGRFTYRTLEIILWLLALWAICSQLLPAIRVNTGYKPAANGVEIFIRSNGVHTDFVLPVRHSIYSWDSVFRPGDFNADSTYRYVALGWGDKGFFLNTPTWDDLTFSTAFVAASGIGESAMHVDFVATVPKNNPHIRQFVLSEEQYRNLISYITGSFQRMNRSVRMIDHAGYGKHDKFFEANGQYSLFMTCNEWTGDGMEACGLPVGVWTPLEHGIMK
ncbi:MAG TPA: TIGR02117 family protein [Bacteroidia bacterium]|nr:TIGR02117 family protein [Bacteroidia bacterium]